MYPQSKNTKNKPSNYKSTVAKVAVPPPSEGPLVAEGAAAPPPKHDAMGKFFYLWFGIPFAAILAAAWAIGHC